MDAAETLFWSKDFDHTSTNDILNKVGTARGTLYYHFKSKEDILYAMIGRMTERLTATAAKIARDESVSVLERLSQTIIAMNVGENVGTEFIEQIHKPQKKLLSWIVPVIAQLAEEGIRQGIFHTDYSVQAAGMLMLYSNEAFDSRIIQSEEEKQQRMPRRLSQ